MRDVYEISSADSDSQAATCETPGWLTMPTFDCPVCGEEAWQEPVWYASLQPTPEAIAAFSGPLPEKVATRDEYAAIRGRLRELLKTNARLSSASIVGALPVEVGARGFSRQVKRKQLAARIDFVWANLFNCIVSQKVFQLLADCGLDLPAGNIVFKSAEETFEGYRVLELEPQLIWDESDLKKYAVSVCDFCDHITKNMGRDTYKMRHFNGEIFGKGPAIVRGRESTGFYINQPLHELLMRENLSGVSVKKVGEYV